MHKRGYTFIELTVVLFLIGLMFTLAVPRFRYALLTDNLKNVTRKMAGIIKGLRSEAIREHEAFILHFGLDSDIYWIESASMTEEERMLAREQAFSLPGDVRIMDVWFKEKGKIIAGETAIRFNKRGYVQQSVIHLGSEDGREFTLILSPFLSKIKVIEKYVDFETT